MTTMNFQDADFHLRGVGKAWKLIFWLPSPGRKLRNTVLQQEVTATNTYNF